MRWSTRSGRPLILGHRGASAVALENTTAAFEAARAAGADGVERDVQRCATGELIVFHDQALQRRADGRERVTDPSPGGLPPVGPL